MYVIYPSNSYRRSYRKLSRNSNFPIAEIDRVINLLASGKLLSAKYRDHKLQGEFADYRECHIQGDLLLMYQIKNQELVLVLIDIGTHAQLFG